jgi:uncharacterized membrane protein YfcA
VITPVILLIALATGLGMGVLGGGGSIIVVPVLTFMLGFAPKDAVAASLTIVALVAGAGAAAAMIRGALPLRLGLIVGTSATIGGLIGGTIGTRLVDHTQLLLLAAVMFTAAIVMWRIPARGQAATRPASTATLIGIGGATGVMTGLVGVGGGFLIVPALVLAAGLTMQRAATASLLVITMSALAAMSRYATGAMLHWSFIGPFALVAAAGSVTGGVIAHRLPQRILQQAFAVALVILGSYVLLKA